MIESGTTLQGRFLIEERIGEGGMGAVYRAIDQKFGSQVAVKETFYGDAELAEAFEREARLLNSLHHPIFPHVSDHFTENGGHFLVMEYIEGEDMSGLLKQGAIFAVADVMRWTLDLLDGLDYLHSQEPPIIHRDIKPNNLKLTSRGNIMLLDFGMAKENSGDTLGMRSVFGYSRRYSPLEQIEGTGTDARSDIFSLGATVFHLLTGKPPVDVLARASAIVSGRPDPLLPANLIRSDVPELVSAMIQSALALNPEQRFVSARAMWNALEVSLNGDGGESTAEPAVEPDDAVAPVVVSSEGVFPALEAFRAERDEEQPEAASNFEDEAVPVEHVDEGDKSRPLARAVIHLDSVDERDASSGPAVTEPVSPGGFEVEQLSTALPPPADTRSTRFSRSSIWLPLIILGAVLGTLVIYGLLNSSAENADVEAAAVAPAAEVRQEEPGTEGSFEEPQQTASSDAGPGSLRSDEIAANTDPGSADTVPLDPDPEGRTDEGKATRERNEGSPPLPDDQNKAGDHPARSRNMTPDDRDIRPRQSRSSQARRQSSATERPRIVDVTEEPEVVRIETIFTGIPYEKRRRWHERQIDDEEEFRRWRQRERRRNRRPAFPPF